MGKLVTVTGDRLGGNGGHWLFNYDPAKLHSSGQQSGRNSKASGKKATFAKEGKSVMMRNCEFLL
jgi:hypothetical protein